MTVGGDDDAEFAALAERLHWNMFRIASAIRRREYAGVGDNELTLTQCSILYRLRDGGRTRLTDLAAYEGVRKPTMTAAITRLENLGMVERTRDPVDRRVLWIELTPQGVIAQRDAVALTVEEIRANLGAGDLEALRAALVPLERLAMVTESNAGARVTVG